MALQLHELSRRYGTTVALDRVSLELPPGKVLGLLGPSGSGKSTLLRLVAGLEQPDGGRVSFAGRDLTRVPAQHRNFGVVFQDYALFPHLNVAANIAFGLVERRWPAGKRSARVSELLTLTGLDGLGSRRVQQLSGGQQQRVALARALAPRPELLLLDEPLSNLDAALRETLTDSLAQLLSLSGLPAVHVTHDQAEAFRLADLIGILRAGRLVQFGAARDVYRTPANAWTARFLGYRNVYDTGPSGRSGPVLLDDGQVSIRPHSAGDRAATVSKVMPRGSGLELELAPEGWAQPLMWRGHPRELHADLRPGDRLGLDIPEAAWLELSPE